ncbi:MULTISPECIES: zinc-dependent alcohol dehydrogenase [unclassified Saccharothrix]|uniref:zinc-dependent alcohol dehydrogenase n=1 Tax=unclassified Saccharothrix TaxID=2593673 RepID=UPI00307DEBD8
MSAPQHTRRLVGTWPTGTMPAAVITGPKRVEVAAVPVPERRSGHVLVRTHYLGLCGTDLELFHGTASYLRDGRARYPHVFGHEWWGEVVAADDAPGFAPGDPVVGHTMITCGECARCLGGARQQCTRMTEVGLYDQQGAAAKYIRMPAHALTALPESLAVPWAVFVEPAVTVVEAFRRARVRPDDRVAVVGTGTIGLLSVQLATKWAQHVIAVGVDPAGLALAGVPAHLVLDAPAGEHSLVVEASGGAGAFGTAVRLVERGGRIALVGVSNEPEEGLVPGDLALRGITVLGVQHGIDHYAETVRMFADGTLDGARLVAAVVPARTPERAFELLEHGRSGPPKVIIGADW